MPRIPTLRHVYGSVAELNDTLTSNGSTLLASDSSGNARKLEMLDEVSRLIDARAHRGSGFGPWIGTRQYDGQRGDVLYLRADLAELDELSISSAVGATPSVPTVETDFYLAGIGGYDEPFRKVILHGQGTPTAFGFGPRLTSVSGTWSYPYRTRVLTGSLDEELDDVETEIDVSDLAGLSPGVTLLIDDEQMFVTAVTAGEEQDSITVERGVNGTTAAAHDDEATIARFVYDASVHTLALRLAEKRWKARDAGADGLDSGPDVGTISLREGEDTIIRRMIGSTVMLSGQV